jgi:hypothetical protein
MTPSYLLGSDHPSQKIPDKTTDGRANLMYQKVVARLRQNMPRPPLGSRQLELNWEWNLNAVGLIQASEH